MPRRAASEGKPYTSNPACIWSELAFKVQLEAAAGVRGGRSAKIGICRKAAWKKASRDADECHIVRVVQDVEDIERGGQNRAVFFLFLEVEIVRHINVEVQQPRPMQRIARSRTAVRAVVEHSVTIQILSGGDVDGLAGIRLESYSEREETGRLEGAKQIQFVAAVIIGARPIQIREIAVAGEIGDAAGVVVRLAKDVLRLSGKIFGRLAAKRNLERIALLIAFRFHLADLAERRVGPGQVIGRKRSVDVTRHEEIDPARAHVGGAERALRSDLPLNASAVLNNLRDSGVRIEDYQAGGHANKVRRRDRIRNES